MDVENLIQVQNSLKEVKEKFPLWDGSSLGENVAYLAKSLDFFVQLVEVPLQRLIYEMGLCPMHRSSQDVARKLNVYWSSRSRLQTLQYYVDSFVKDPYVLQMGQTLREDLEHYPSIELDSLPHLFRTCMERGWGLELLNVVLVYYEDIEPLFCHLLEGAKRSIPYAFDGLQAPLELKICLQRELMLKLEESSLVDRMYYVSHIAQLFSSSMRIILDSQRWTIASTVQ